MILLASRSLCPVVLLVLLHNWLRLDFLSNLSCIKGLLVVYKSILHFTSTSLGRRRVMLYDSMVLPRVLRSNSEVPIRLFAVTENSQRLALYAMARSRKWFMLMLLSLVWKSSFFTLSINPLAGNTYSLRKCSQSVVGSEESSGAVRFFCL